MPDMLKEIFDIQEMLNDRIFSTQEITSGDGKMLTMERIRNRLREGALGPNGEPNRWLMKYLTALEAESDELRKELLWKWWSKDKINIQNIRVEIVDMLHFLVSLALCAGMDADDFHRIYMKKNEVNFRRQETGYSLATKDESDNRNIM